MTNTAPIVVVQPSPGRSVSGGYLYNQRLTEGAPDFQLLCAPPEAKLDTCVTRNVNGPALLLLDSIFLEPSRSAELAELTRRFTTGWLIHAFPSFIHRAHAEYRPEALLRLRPTPFELSALDASVLVAAPGPYVGELLAAEGAQVPVIVCPPGSEAAAELPPAPASGAGRLHLVSLCNVTPLKRVADALDALLLSAIDWRWTIIGSDQSSPAYAAALWSKVSEHGVDHRVKFTGPVSHQRALQHLREADALLLTSGTENHPLAALDALSSARPVVGYDVGGTRHVIEHGSTGLLTPLGDIEALSGNLRRLSHDAQLLTQLQENCAGAAARLPSWPLASQHAAFALRAALGQHQGP